MSRFHDKDDREIDWEDVAKEMMLNMPTQDVLDVLIKMEFDHYEDMTKFAPWYLEKEYRARKENAISEARS